MNKLILGGALAAAAIMGTALSVRPELVRYELTTKKFDGKLRLLQLSDLHDSLFGSDQSSLIQLIRETKPDLILLTGDMINDTEETINVEGEILNSAHPTRILLDGIKDLAPIFYVWGNHEHNTERCEKLEDELAGLGAVHLGGKRTQIEINGIPLLLAGIDDPRFFGGRQTRGLIERLRDDKTRISPSLEAWRTALDKLEGSSDYSILLSHRPEEYECYYNSSFDLVLSGHAHGGQWRIPYLVNGVYAPHQGIFPEHAGGIYRGGRVVHIVSRGLSTKRAPRIFNRPEVTLVTLHGKQSAENK